MKWKLLFGGLGLGAVLAVVVAFLVVVAAVGGVWWFVTDDRPLLYYDARPAYVPEAGVASAGYETLNTTDVNLSYSVIPFVGRDVRVRAWASVYATGIPRAEDPPAGNGGPSIDPADTSVVTVFSMSALQVGPVAVNPLVYASDPNLLNESGVLLDTAEGYLPRNVTDVSDVSIRSGDRVRMLGQDTEMTTFTGQLELANDTRVDVRLYLARVVHDGELVIVFGIAPQDDGDGAAIRQLVESVRMADWGTTPDLVQAASAAAGVRRVPTGT